MASKATVNQVVWLEIDLNFKNEIHLTDLDRTRKVIAPQANLSCEKLVFL